MTEKLQHMMHSNNRTENWMEKTCLDDTHKFNSLRIKKIYNITIKLVYRFRMHRKYGCQTHKIHKTPSSVESQCTLLRVH